MTLKEKFTTMVLDKDIADWEKVCEKIAEEFAIEFAKWLMDSHVSELTLKEFKKEKNYDTKRKV